MVWAFHSHSQDLLLDSSVKNCANNRLEWANAKSLGIFIWLQSSEVMVSRVRILLIRSLILFFL